MARAFIEVYGDEIVAQEMFSTADRAKDMKPFWPAVQDRLHDIEREQFDSMGSRSGNPWPPLAQSTLWQKFREGENLAMMRATDELYNSLTGLTSHSVRGMGDDYFIFGSTANAMGPQQDHPAGANYPERLPIDLSQQDELEFAEMMLNYIIGTIDRRGRLLPQRGTGGRFTA